MATTNTANPGGRHGEGSDEKQQGKEEAEGRAQFEEEGRRPPVAVAIRSGAARSARPQPLWQEGLGIGRPGKPRSAIVAASAQVNARRDGPGLGVEAPSPSRRT